LSLKWLRETLRLPQSYGEMDALAASVPIGAERLLFLPYLQGERSPHPDPNARGVFFGLSAIHRDSHMIRAVLEGVAYSQRECVDVFRELGVNVDDMTFTGGGARSALWRQMLADLYGCPVKTLANDEGAALGAAMLAAGALDSRPAVSGAVAPNGGSADAYETYYRVYASLYPMMKPAFNALTALGRNA
jgi:xylulokinase